MATKIVFAPKMPDPIMERARSMVPQGFELVEANGILKFRANVLG